MASFSLVMFSFAPSELLAPRRLFLRRKSGFDFADGETIL